MEYFAKQLSLINSGVNEIEGVPFWRTEVPLFAQGYPATRRIVKGGFWPEQREWWELKNFIKCFVGGYGSGKTNVGSKRIIALALQNAPIPVATVSPTYTIARRTVVETIQNLLSGKQTIYGPANFRWKYNKSDHEFRIWWHGREALIYVYSGEDPNMLKGPNLAAAWIDEPFIQDYEVFTQMIARVRHPDSTVMELNLTGTPEQLNWGYDLCMGELEEANDVGYVRASTRSNLAYGDGYVRRLEGVFTEEAAEAFIEGQFKNLAKGMVYYAFSPEKNKKDFKEPDGAEWGVGMDFNVDPFAFTVFWRVGNHMQFIAEHELPNADTEYAAQFIREKYPKVRTIYPDPTGGRRNTAAPGGKSDFWFLKQAGFTVSTRKTSPSRKDRYNSVNSKLGPKKGDPTVTVASSCKKLIKYLSIYSHQEMNKQESMSHLLDAFSYPIEYLFPVNKETLEVLKLQGL